VLTRPLGASIGDYLSQARRDGGLTTATSALFLIVILGVVVFLAIDEKRAVAPQVASPRNDELVEEVAWRSSARERVDHRAVHVLRATDDGKVRFDVVGCHQEIRHLDREVDVR
jgi:hypothetical protein